MRKFEEVFTVRKLVKHFNMEVINEGDLDFQLKLPSLYHVGYELIGFFDEKGEELNKYLHIYGKKEARFVDTLPHEKKAEMWDKYFSYGFPALIITAETKVTDEMIVGAKKNNKTILKSPMRTTKTIRELKFFLSKELAEEKMINGYMLLEIMGVGVLLTGYEDAKLGVTIELLERGHKLVTDNNLIIRRMAENDLEGYNRFDKSQMDSHFFIQNTDGSQIDVTTQFGIKATRKMKRIDMLVVLEEWNEKKFYDRLGLDEVYEEFLGEKILKLVIPVRRGRNLAIILETAALNYRLKKMGVNSAEYFMKESQKIIKANKAKQGDNMNEKKLPVKKLKDEFNLKVLHGEEILENTYIKVTGIHRPSLALSGYVDMYEDEGYTGVQLFSKVEFKYLSSLDAVSYTHLPSPRDS